MKKPSDLSKIPTLQSLKNERMPAWLWEVKLGQIIWANTSGLSFWNEQDIIKLSKRYFDRSMPAITVMLELIEQEIPKDGVTRDFLFWTPNGAQNIKCQCKKLIQGDGWGGMLLHAYPTFNKENIIESNQWQIETTLENELPNSANFADTTYKNTLSAPEDQETLKEIARLLSNPDEIDDVDHGMSSDVKENDIFVHPPKVNGTTQLPHKDSNNTLVPLKTNGADYNHTNIKAYNHFEINSSRQFDQSKNLAFFAKVSHEVRTPLNSIIGFAELMKDEHLGKIGHKKYQSYAEDIFESAQHALSLIDDLLDISKVEVGEFTLNKSAVDLNKIVEYCISSLHPQTAKAQLVIRQSLNPNLSRVSADQRSLRQILLNLISNAIKFTPPGGQIIISTQAVDHNKAKLRVRDTGIGMSSQDLQIALEPFKQLETTTSSNPTGTGLGLPLTKALTEANDGQFLITSQAGKGTLIEVILPYYSLEM